MKRKKYLLLSVIIACIGGLSLISTKSIVITGLFEIAAIVICITSILAKK